MKEKIVLGYAGGGDSLAALTQFVRDGRDVIAVTVDVGQERDVDEVRAQALAAGALRAHVFDAREELARDYLIPALRTRSPDALDPQTLAAPLVARKLAEVATIEHAAAATGEYAFDTAPDPRRGRGRGRTLLERPVADATRTPDAAAHVELQIENGIPVAINGVPLSVAELLESLALIAGQHGIGRLPHIEAPAAPIVHAAYDALAGRDGHVRFELRQGTMTIVSTHDGNPQLVNHA